MNPLRDARPFPIPVVAALGPGVRIEDEILDCIAMPQGMAMYHPPVLPEPEEISGCAGAVRVLNDVLDALRLVAGGVAPKRATARVMLSGLQAEDVTLINQVLGEGEVSAQVLVDEGTPTLQIQESVFAGVWRVMGTHQDGALHDYIEVGAVPEVLRETAQATSGMSLTSTEFRMTVSIEL